MDDTRTFWLVVTNVLLGVAVALCVLGVACEAVREFVSRVRKRRAFSKELDRDMKRYFGR